MTRNNDRDGIAVVRHAYGTKRVRMPDGLGNVAITASLTVRDVEQGAPALQLKIGAAQVEWEREVLAIAVEIFVEFTEPGGQGIGGFLPCLAVAFGGLSAIEFEFQQAAVREGEEQGACGGSGAGKINGFHDRAARITSRPVTTAIGEDGLAGGGARSTIATKKSLPFSREARSLR